MKLFKKLGILILLTIFNFLIIFNQQLNYSIKAYDTAFDDSYTASYTVTASEETSLFNSAIHYKDQAITQISSTKNLQQVNVLTQKCDSNSKLVTWAVKNNTNTGFVRRTVSDIARDYELNHPGWKVVGGVNADQYFTKSGQQGHADGSDYFYPQPYGSIIADGEKWFSINAKPYGGNGTYFAGFLNDGSPDQILDGRTNWSITTAERFYISGLYVSILDEYDDVVKKFKVDKFNEAALENESSLYTPFNTGTSITPIEVSTESPSSLAIVTNAEQAYVSNSITYTYKGLYDGKNIDNAQNAFFGKGTISKIDSTATLSASQFAIETKNQEIKDALQVGTRIVVQYEFEGALNNVEAGTGYHTIMRTNDKDISSTNAYNTKQYPRSFFGRKADGTLVLIAVDGLQVGKVGTNQLEGLALLQYYGVVEAYQMDGGGSVTMVVRENDNFKVVNSPSDGSARSVLSALLFVVRDVKMVFVQTEATGNSITFYGKVTDTINRTIDKVYVEIDSKKYLLENNKVTIDNLDRNKKYNYYVYVEENQTIQLTDYQGVAYTIMDPPSLLVCKVEEVDQHYEFTPIFIDENLIKNVELQINTDKYTLENNKFIVNDFQSIEKVTLLITYQSSPFGEDIIIEINNPQYLTAVFYEYSLNDIDEIIKDIY